MTADTSVLGGGVFGRRWVLGEKDEALIQERSALISFSDFHIAHTPSAPSLTHTLSLYRSHTLSLSSTFSPSLSPSPPQSLFSPSLALPLILSISLSLCFSRSFCFSCSLILPCISMSALPVCLSRYPAFSIF